MLSKPVNSVIHPNVHVICSLLYSIYVNLGLIVFINYENKNKQI